MEIRTEQTVRDIAVGVAGATRVFETMGIDYCCGGGRSLGEACDHAGVEPAAVLRALETASVVPDETPVAALAALSLEELIVHIVEKHHVYTKDALGRVTMLFDKVCAAHGERHPELFPFREVFVELRNDLVPHMMKEEQVLFPYVVAMEHAEAAGRPRPLPMFGTVKNPIRMMSLEHDTAGDLLARLRDGSDGYTVPADGCMSFRTLYGALEELEKDLHEHIHLENNLLFPKAVELEARS
jgi:regulator of cell morphogenesis and NO signaling